MKNIFDHLSSRPKEYAKMAFAAILLLYLFFSVSYSLYTPAFDGPDEHWHYHFIRTIHDDEYRLKLFLQHNPLYYVVNGFLLKLVPAKDDVKIKVNPKYQPQVNKFIQGPQEKFPYDGTSFNVHVLRFFSILCGLITILITYYIAAAFFKPRVWSPVFVAGIVALVPKFVFINAVLNNDVLVWTFATTAIFFLLRLSDDPARGVFLFWLSVFTGLAYLTKTNGIILVPIILCTFLYWICIKKISMTVGVKLSLIFMAVSFASGLWYVALKAIGGLNLDNLHVKSLYMLFTAAHKTKSIPELETAKAVRHITNYQFIYYKVFELWWSGLGWHTIRLPKLSLQLAEIICAVSAIGLIRLAFQKKIRQTLLQENRLVVFIIAVAFMIAAELSYQFFQGSGVARNMFPVISVFGCLFVLGWLSLFHGNRIRFVIILPLCLLVAFNFQLLSRMKTHYRHGFKSDYINPHEYLLDIYWQRPDMIKAFPETKQGDFRNIFRWAQNRGVREYHLLEINKPILLLINSYNSDKALQNRFPEVSREKKIDRLVMGAAENEIPELEPYRQYYVRYNQSFLQE